MPIVLARIDDRLVHGQVTEGWGKALRPDRIVVVSDRVSCSPWEEELCIASLPEKIQGEVVSVSDAASVINRSAKESDRSYILFESPADAYRAVRDGARLTMVNVGGMHSVKGKRRLLDYIYVNETDSENLKALAAAGVALDFRDLPEHESVDVSGKL
jgi:mannose PTS system EIIA component